MIFEIVMIVLIGLFWTKAFDIHIYKNFQSVLWNEIFWFIILNAYVIFSIIFYLF